MRKASIDSRRCNEWGDHHVFKSTQYSEPRANLLEKLIVDHVESSHHVPVMEIIFYAVYPDKARRFAKERTCTRNADYGEIRVPRKHHLWLAVAETGASSGRTGPEYAPPLPLHPESPPAFCKPSRFDSATMAPDWLGLTAQDVTTCPLRKQCTPILHSIALWMPQ